MSLTFRGGAIEISDSNSEPSHSLPEAELLRRSEKEMKGMRRVRKMKVRGRGAIGSKSDALYPLPNTDVLVSSDSSDSSFERRQRKKRSKEEKRKRKNEKRKREEKKQ